MCPMDACLLQCSFHARKPVTARGDGGITTTSTSFPARGAAKESWFLSGAGLQTHDRRTRHPLGTRERERESESERASARERERDRDRNCFSQREREKRATVCPKDKKRERERERD